MKRNNTLHTRRQASMLAWMTGGSLLAMMTGASAQQAIGEATMVQNDVTAARKGSNARLAQGGDVFQNEVVRTGISSQAQLTFVDNTNVSVAASSQLTLDKFVYNGNHTASNVTFNAARGSFRFISGDSPSGAYKVITPQAAIGVRGTVYDVQAQGGSTNVVLIEGSANVCLRVNGRTSARCVQLTQPCQSVTITNGNIGSAVPANWSFDASCGAAPPALQRPDAPWGNGTSPPPPPPTSPPEY